MEKKIQYIIMVIIALGVIFAAVTIFKKVAAPLLGEKATTAMVKPLADEDEVIVTLDDGCYHRPNCDKLRGPTRRTVFRLVKNNSEPCPYCIGEIKPGDE